MLNSDSPHALAAADRPPMVDGQRPGCCSGWGWLVAAAVSAIADGVDGKLSVTLTA